MNICLNTSGWRSDLPDTASGKNYWSLCLLQYEYVDFPVLLGKKKGSDVI